MTESPLKVVHWRQLSDAGSDAERAEVRSGIVAACLAGNVVVFKGVNLGVDLREFDMNDTFPPDLCKIGIIADQTPVDSEFHQRLPFRLVYRKSIQGDHPFVRERDLAEICERSFGGDWSRFDRFLQNCRSAETMLRRVATEVLKDHHYYADCPVMRFSLPEVTALHLDNSPNPERKESLRFFVNLDDRPRIWQCSLNILEFIEKEYDNLGLRKYFQGSNPDRMLKLSKRISKSSEFQNLPRTTVQFEPGDMWAFDARMASHHVLEGRRALSMTAKMSLSRLPPYHVSLKDRLFSLHERKFAEQRTATIAARRAARMHDQPELVRH